jgi:hypothetical protein
MLTLDLKITLETPLHIGTGEESEIAQPVARDSRGRPCIRASTLKGIHRAATEQIAAALGLSVCDATLARRMCQPLPGETACAVCHIFGSPWLPGRIFYRDLTTNAAPVVDTRVRAAQSRRRHVQLSIDEQAREILPASVTFAGQVNHLLSENVSLALAIAGLRSIRALGAGSATGWGLCHIDVGALDGESRPVDESVLAAALERVRVRP